MNIWSDTKPWPSVTFLPKAFHCSFVLSKESEKAASSHHCVFAPPELWPVAFLFWTLALGDSDSVALCIQLLTYTDTWASLRLGTARSDLSGLLIGVVKGTSPVLCCHWLHEPLTGGEERGEKKTCLKIYSSKFHLWNNIYAQGQLSWNSIRHTYLIRLKLRLPFIHKEKTLKTLGSHGVYFTTSALLHLL